MKKFIVSIICFFVAIGVIDFCFGHIMDYMNSHAKGGGIAKRNYICCKANEEIMLFGSSRMAHHYVPSILTDSLKMTCYNCGQDGNGIILSYSYLQMILERQTPQIIIYDVSSFDIYKDDNLKYISLLKPYCENPKVMDIIKSVSATEEYKLKSSLYRYNSLCIRTVGSFLYNGSNYNGGFEPLYKQMNYEPDIIIQENADIDLLKLCYLKKFIETCQHNDICLVFIVSPRYRSSTISRQYKEVSVIADKYNVPFLDYTYVDSISDTKELFQDQTHMNINGATEFTKIIVDPIRRILNQKNLDEKDSLSY